MIANMIANPTYTKKDKPVSSLPLYIKGASSKKRETAKKEEIVYIEGTLTVAF